jgi:hypothetical protein
MSSRWNNKILTLTLVLAPLFKASEIFFTEGEIHL